MFVWPPMPLQPLEDGADRKLAHSDKFALPMMIAPAAFSFCAMNASAGVLPASAHEPAVGRSCVGEGRRADRDHRVEHRVEVADAPEIEVRQLDGVDPARVHQLL